MRNYDTFDYIFKWRLKQSNHLKMECTHTKMYIQTDQEDNNLRLLEQEPFLEIFCGMASGKLYVNKFRGGGRTN